LCILFTHEMFLIFADMLFVVRFESIAIAVRWRSFGVRICQLRNTVLECLLPVLHFYH